MIDNVSIAQTGAIARFCGKLSGLYPKNNPIEAAKIDQFIDFVTDLNVLFSNTNTISEQTKKVAARTELAEGLLRRKLLMLEKCIQPDSNWVSSKTITIADIAIWRLLGWFTSGVIDGFPKDMITLFPKLTRPISCCCFVLLLIAIVSSPKVLSCLRIISFDRHIWITEAHQLHLIALLG